MLTSTQSPSTNLRTCPPAKRPRLDVEQRYLNRELSWLEFNARVLAEGFDVSLPLLERLKFLCIFSRNLDEFFMVRVAGLYKMLREGLLSCESADKSSIRRVLEEVSRRSRELIRQQYHCLHEEIFLGLRQHGIELLEYKQLSRAQKKSLTVYFEEEVFPVLTPLAVDPSHPHPFLTNLSLYLLVEFHPEEFVMPAGDFLGFVEVPKVIPRLVQVSAGSQQYILLESLITAHLERLFPGFRVRCSGLIRVTRNLDYTLLESRIVDLLEAVEREVVHRAQPESVRLELGSGVSPQAVAKMQRVLNLSKESVFTVPSLVDISGLGTLVEQDLPALKVDEFNPRLPRWMEQNRHLFALIRERDLLVHHPYESFYAVTEFLNFAALDKDVYAIKQTLYRSSGASLIIEALIKAAENGKQVTAVVELKARFDERNNIEWARKLERSGVHVVYGFVGLKTHGKMTLVVRKEKRGMRRYVHLSTGNYNPITAKLYTDLGLFTSHDGIASDIAALFNLLTGFNVFREQGKVFQTKAVPRFSHIFVAPLFLRQKIIDEIDLVIAHHRKEGGGLVMAKLNGLDDQAIIDKLYEASTAGVVVRLLVRGICCLRPGVKGLSENIEVLSIVDRFLEHSRIYYFRHQQHLGVYLSSADWMTRNMDRRIDIMFPVYDSALIDRILYEVLGCTWQDNTKSWVLSPEGTYRKRCRGGRELELRSQYRFMDIAREDGLKSIPYDEAIRFCSKSKIARPLAPKENIEV